MIKRTVSLFSAAALVVVTCTLPGRRAQTVQRTASGRPDLSGTYNAATLTPLERPAQLGDKAYLTRRRRRPLPTRRPGCTPWVMSSGKPRARRLRLVAPRSSDSRAPQPEATSSERATSVPTICSGSNRGSGTFTVDGKIPTSIIVDPGQRPHAGHDADGHEGAGGSLRGLPASQRRHCLVGRSGWARPL